MNKKIKNLFLAGALVLGLAGVTVSCTDYDKDINDLQNKITNVEGTVSTLSSNVAALQAAINAGAVITNVSALSGEPGGWKFTLSDGKSYDVTNGKNGTNGTNGKDGKWYTPNAETGCWDVHEMVDGKEVVTATTQKYLPENGTTVEYDAANNALIITQGENTATLKLTASGETSLVFIPTCYVDGVEGFEAVSFYYQPLYPTGLDSKKEQWAGKEGEELVQLSPAVGVQFHVNISNAELDDTYTYEFINKTDKKYISSRAPQSADFDVIPTFTSYEDGILSLAVEVVGKEATDEYITTMALQVTKDSVALVSDYFTVLSGTIEQLRIADPKAVVKVCKPSVPNYDEHYRRGTVGISVVDPEDLYLPDKEVWIENNSLAEAHSYCDTAVAYTGELDLKAITVAHYVITPEEEVDTVKADCFEMTPEELEAYGLKFTYEVVKNYIVGDPETDQRNFVDVTKVVEDGIFKPATYDTEGTAAIGRTPIIRVKIMDGANVVEVAYIKVYIAAGEVGPNPSFELIPRRDAKDDGENIFRFSCDADSLMTTVKDMNLVIYNGMNMSKDQFHALYDSLKIAPQEDTIGTVADVVIDPVQGTHVISWKLTADELWEYSGEPVEIIARYYSSKNPDVYVDIKLTATVEEVSKSVALESAKGDYIYEYWEAEKFDDEGNEVGTHYFATKYNVNVPADKDTTADNCQFENDINASFVTYPKGTAEAGKLKVDNVDSVAYFFCKDVANIKSLTYKDQKHKPILDENGKEQTIAVTFKVVSDTILMATIKVDGEDVTDTVATITNVPQMKGETKVWNMFNWVKGKTVADTLLNTNDMHTYIGATAFLCTATEGVTVKEVAVTFDGNDHFRANVLQPVFVNTKAGDKFIDAVDFGEKGSYIKIEDLLDPFDWRARMFSKYPTYWQYYGPFEVVIDAANAQCDLNGVRQPVPATIVLTQTPVGETKVKDPVSGVEVTLPKNDAGYLTYKNNGTNVTSDFNIFVKAKVAYGFGYIDSDWITIPVDKTIGQ